MGKVGRVVLSQLLFLLCCSPYFLPLSVGERTQGVARNGVIRDPLHLRGHASEQFHGEVQGTRMRQFISTTDEVRDLHFQINYKLLFMVRFHRI